MSELYDLESKRFRYWQYVPINRNEVRRALDRLLYHASNRSPSDLIYLLLVDDFLSQPSAPSSLHDREFALNDILTSLIYEKFAALRQVLDLDEPNARSTKAEAIATIERDAQINNHDLMAWSWLYHHYIRVDLDISQVEFSRAAHLEGRTLRRYQNHALNRLTTDLNARERAARDIHYERRLYSGLPIPARMHLFGRDYAKAELRRLITSTPIPHVQVTGEAGIGKSMLVQEVVREQIDIGEIDYVIWVDSPTSVQNVYDHIATTLMRNSPRTYSLRDYASIYEIVIVLDDIQRLDAEKTALEKLLDDLSTEVVYLTHRTFTPFKNTFAHLSLTEIEPTAALDYLRLMAAQDSRFDGWGDMDELFIEIIEDIGGNPFALRQALYAFLSDHGDVSGVQ